MSAATAHAENPHAGQGSVILDIGGDVGALVVTMPPGMEGVEVEIRPAHGSPAHAHHPHVAVVDRPTPGGVIPSLVFPEVEQGRYGLYPKGTDDLRLMVTVLGGEVTSAEWTG
ncbi:MAG: hypothetical protein JWR90_1876 [Marmoricola sp.]|jgi:hypothetical protein|nr:hypothetical protein [Marmoricola sp.]